MKNPNRYGTITRLSGNRRRPYLVREGTSGHQRPIGYAATRQEALILLAQYNQNPWDLDTHKTTLDQLFTLWAQKRLPKLGASNRASLKSAYKHLSAYAHVPYITIKAHHMQDTIDTCGGGPSLQNTIKNLWRHLDRFALELDLTTRQYSTLLTAQPHPETTRKPFTDEEVALLWNSTHPIADTALILLYTGMRITELLTLTVEQIDRDRQTIICGIKTTAGKNRLIPIHSKIRPLIAARIADRTTGPLLLNHLGRPYNATTYRAQWADLMTGLGISHTPHECRHTLRSRLDSAGANKVAIDRILGHASVGTGEKVYTHKTLAELRANIELVTN